MTILRFSRQYLNLTPSCVARAPRTRHQNISTVTGGRCNPHIPQHRNGDGSHKTGTLFEFQDITNTLRAKITKFSEIARNAIKVQEIK